MQSKPRRGSTSLQSLLRQKKGLFQHQIRKHEKDRILNLLRQQALLPEEICQSLQGLPQSLHQVLKFISCKEGIPGGWSKAISDKLYEAFSRNPQPFFGSDVAVNVQISLAMFIVLHKQISSSEFDAIWDRLQANSKAWLVQQQKILLKLLADAIHKIDFKYLRPAKQILSRSQDRFDIRTLNFYNFALKHCPHEAFLNNVLNPQLFSQIIDHLKIFFYLPSEKVKMCEILIQVLYQSTAEVVAEAWNLSRLFDTLEFFMGCDTRLLIQRSLILIYNVNIDCGSRIFLAHPCAEAVIQEMQNDDLPLEIRELMGDTYLSALANLPRPDIPKYIKNHSKILQAALNYIIQEFSQSKDIRKGIQDTLKMMLESDEQSDSTFRNWLKSKPQLVDAVTHTEFGKELLQQYGVL